jgi:hypothetical protein
MGSNRNATGHKAGISVEDSANQIHRQESPRNAWWILVAVGISFATVHSSAIGTTLSHNRYRKANGAMLYRPLIYAPSTLRIRGGEEQDQNGKDPQRFVEGGGRDAKTQRTMEVDEASEPSLSQSDEEGLRQVCAISPRAIASEMLEDPEEEEEQEDPLEEEGLEDDECIGDAEDIDGKEEANADNIEDDAGAIVESDENVTATTLDKVNDTLLSKIFKQLEEAVQEGAHQDFGKIASELIAAANSLTKGDCVAVLRHIAQAGPDHAQANLTAASAQMLTALATRTRPLSVARAEAQDILDFLFDMGATPNLDVLQLVYRACHRSGSAGGAFGSSLIAQALERTPPGKMSESMCGAVILALLKHNMSNDAASLLASFDQAPAIAAAGGACRLLLKACAARGREGLRDALSVVKLCPGACRNAEAVAELALVCARAATSHQCRAISHQVVECCAILVDFVESLPQEQQVRDAGLAAQLSLAAERVSAACAFVPGDSCVTATRMLAALQQRGITLTEHTLTNTIMGVCRSKHASMLLPVVSPVFLGFTHAP